MSHIEATICVRDRRERHQFSIHNKIIDHWLPIIGTPGLALYSLYVRMSNKKDERCYPGYTLIANHIGISTATVCHYNRLLVICNLIYIHRSTSRRKPNNYYILDIPPCNEHQIQRIRNQAVTYYPPSSNFLRALLKRLARWVPIETRWSDDRPTIIHPDQLRLWTLPGKDPTSLGKDPTSLGKDSTSPSKVEQSERTIRRNNQQQQQGDAVVVDGWEIATHFNEEQSDAFQSLMDNGVTPQVSAELVVKHSDGLGRIESWLKYAAQLGKEGFEFDNYPGFIVAGLRSNQAALPPSK